MRTGARIAVVLGLIGPVGVGCASIAGIEDLSLTASPDASDESQPSGDATMDTSGSSSGSSGSSSGGDAKSDTSSQVDAGSCTPGQIRCSGNGVQTCGGDGMWAAPQACVDQTCVAGACVGMCAPSQTHPVPCGNCGMDTQTCTSTGTWQSSGNCSGEGACAPTTTQGCNTYGTQTCTASCTWGTCSCPSTPACTPGQAQCASGGVETCGACGQYGNPVACGSGTCVGGMCSGSCNPGQKQCSGNSAQTCDTSGMWQTTSACPSQTCINGTCTGVCAPGQTDPVSCGNCGTDTQTCDSTGNWKSSGSCNGQGTCTPQATMQCNTYGTETCSSSCAWGACSCTSTPVCTPGAHQCSGNGVQTCSQCGQWGSPVSCGTGMTCTGGGTCVNTGTDCPGNFLLCDGFESGSIDTTTKWQSPDCPSPNSMSVGSVAHSGSHALHVAMQQVNGTAYETCTLKTQQASIFSATPMYFRAWVYFQNFIPGTDNTLVITTPSSANGQSASGGMGINAVGDFIAGQSNSGADYEKTSTSQFISPNTWTCIELGINTNYSTYPNGLLQAYDTTSGTPDLTGNANLQSLVSALFGLTYNGPAAPTDLYIDDIAISNSYVGCSQ